MTGAGPRVPETAALGRGDRLGRATAVGMSAREAVPPAIRIPVAPVTGLAAVPVTARAAVAPMAATAALVAELLGVRLARVVRAVTATHHGAVTDLAVVTVRLVRATVRVVAAVRRVRATAHVAPPVLPVRATRAAVAMPPVGPGVHPGANAGAVTTAGAPAIGPGRVRLSAVAVRTVRLVGGHHD